jgi:hypothetical protein
MPNHPTEITMQSSSHLLSQSSQQSLSSSQESSSAQAALGATILSLDAPWVLRKGQAVTLCPRGAGVLRVTSGRAWATLDVSSHTPLLETGDHFVALGHDLRLRAGQRVVVEAWPHKEQEEITLQWVAASGASMASRWQAAVVEPLRDVGHGLALVARASWRLMAGLASYGNLLTAGRGKVLCGLESNAP